MKVIQQTPLYNMGILANLENSAQHLIDITFLDRPPIRPPLMQYPSTAFQS